MVAAPRFTYQQVVDSLSTYMPLAYRPIPSEVSSELKWYNLNWSAIFDGVWLVGLQFILVSPSVAIKKAELDKWNEETLKLATVHEKTIFSYTRF